MKKNIALLFFLFLFTNLVFAISQSSEWNFDQLIILDANDKFISNSNTNYLVFNVLNSTGNSLNNNEVTCNVYLYSKNNELLQNSTLINGGNNVDKIVTLNSNINIIGDYKYKVTCNSSNEAGYLVNNFFITRSGEDPYNININLSFMSVILMFLGFSVVSIWISSKFDTPENSTLRIVFFWIGIINLLFMVAYYAFVSNCNGDGCYDIGRFSGVAVTYFGAYSLFTVYVLWNYTIQKMRKSTEDWVIKK